MGTFQHDAIIVTGGDTEIVPVYEMAKSIFDRRRWGKLTPGYTNLVTGIARGPSNDQSSFLIAPDGSKEGWENSNDGDDRRDEFVRWLKESPEAEYVTWVAVSFGETGYRITDGADYGDDMAS